MWRRAHSRASKIKTAGFSLKTWKANAVVVQDNPHTRGIAIYTEARCKTSIYYANYVAKEVTHGNVGGTHATHGCACVHDEVPSPFANISINGKISKTKVFQDDNAFKTAVDDHLVFDEIPWYVYAALPGAIDIISEALNTVMQIGEGAL